MNRKQRIEELFEELTTLALEEWPAYTTRLRHCTKCKKSYGINTTACEYDVKFCQKCGLKLENVPKPREYHWPHVHRIHAMMSYKFSGSKKKDWRKVVQATEREFHFMNR